MSAVVCCFAVSLLCLQPGEEASLKPLQLHICLKVLCCSPSFLDFCEDPSLPFTVLTQCCETVTSDPFLGERLHLLLNFVFVTDEMTMSKMLILFLVFKKHLFIFVEFLFVIFGFY